MINNTGRVSAGSVLNSVYDLLDDFESTQTCFSTILHSVDGSSWSIWAYGPTSSAETTGAAKLRSDENCQRTGSDVRRRTDLAVHKRVMNKE